MPDFGGIPQMTRREDGRIVFHVKNGDGDSFYLAPGDISVHRLGTAAREEVFSTCYYHGITIQIDLDHSPQCLSCFFWRMWTCSQQPWLKNICSYLTEHIEQRITVSELADQFGISASQIKSSFSGVYGTSVHTYIRGQRMQAAAKLLRTTDRTVLDIAGQFGYDNGSKFANAIRSVMGVPPAQYRKGMIPTE